MRTPPASVSLLGALVLCGLGGCPADLGGYSIGDNGGGDGAASGGDLGAASGGDLGSSGGGGDGGPSASGVGCGGGPSLLVLVGSNSTAVKSAELWRLPLDQGATPRGCKPLTGGGTIDAFYAQSLAVLGPDRVAVGSFDKVSILDGSDTQVGFIDLQPSGNLGGCALAMAPFAGGGKSYLAVGVNHANGCDQTVVHVQAWDLGNTNVMHPAFDWSCDGTFTGQVPYDLVLSTDANITALAANPWRPSHLLYASSFDPPIAAGDVAYPLSDTAVKGTTLVGAPGPKGSVATLHADRVRAGFVRYAWVVKNYSPDHDYVYGATDSSSDGSAPMVRGPFNCGDMVHCMPQKYDDAVADPLNDGKMIAICEDPATSSSTFVRHVVRFDNSSCELLLDGKAFVFAQYPVALALAGLP